MAEKATEQPSLSPNELLRLFRFGRLLRLDQGGRRACLYGEIQGKQAVVLLERAAFPEADDRLTATVAGLTAVRPLGANDVYSWFLARSGGGGGGGQQDSGGEDQGEGDVKVNVIWPCSDAHVRKFSKQEVRWVNETAEIYARHVRPFMASQRTAARLGWVYNIIDGKSETENVVFRTPGEADEGAGDSNSGRAKSSIEGFLLAKDLNWDGRTIEALHLLCLVERRDLWSVRDLKREHIPWLRSLQSRVLDATCATFPTIRRDQLKMFVHYQPTYYHFHIHVVHLALDSGLAQAVGKALGLDFVLESLRLMQGDGDDAGMDRMNLSYGIGEDHPLWTRIFKPLAETGTAPTEF